jgi:hypothetical protein
VVASGQFAGIAAIGTGIGVPIFLLTAAGGAFIGVLIDSLQKQDPFDKLQA